MRALSTKQVAGLSAVAAFLLIVGLSFWAPTGPRQHAAAPPWAPAMSGETGHHGR